MKAKLFLCCGLLLCLFSCTSQRKMTKLMQTGELAPIRYDGTISPTVAKVNVVLNEKILLNEEPLVHRTKNLFLPLFFYNGWATNFNCSPGLSNLNAHLAQNFIISLHNYLPYSPIAGSLDENTELEVSIDAINSYIPYLYDEYTLFLIFAYITFSKEAIQPASITLKTSYTLKKNGEVVKQGQVQNMRLVEEVVQHSKNTKNLMRAYFPIYFEEFNVLIDKNVQQIVAEL